jgi:hypothetical protein
VGGVSQVSARPETTRRTILPCIWARSNLKQYNNAANSPINPDLNVICHFFARFSHLSRRLGKIMAPLTSTLHTMIAHFQTRLRRTKIAMFYTTDSLEYNNMTSFYSFELRHADQSYANCVILYHRTSISKCNITSIYSFEFRHADQPCPNFLAMTNLNSSA